MNKNMLPIHFFTIVLNGMPFIKYHIGIFQKLSIPWHWHIIEGVADLKYDTAWGIKFGAYVPKEFHNRGLSIDGTSEYLMFLLEQNRENVSIYRKPLGEFWDGKVEMVNEPLKNIKEDCLLWQVDSDELWSLENVRRVYNLFLQYPNKLSAYFYCDYFVGPNKYIVSDGVKSTLPEDWLRVWRFKEGLRWKFHEPPTLVNGDDVNLGKVNPFTREETLWRGIRFQHLAYFTYESILFKESYYGYKGIVDCWKKLQNKRGKVEIGEGFPGIWPGTVVDDWDEKMNRKLLWEG